MITDDEAFYNLMQAYRLSPLADIMGTINAYEAVLDYVNNIDRDAERYHFLFRQSVMDKVFVCRIDASQLGEDQFELLNGSELDAAIDAEMAKAGRP